MKVLASPNMGEITPKQMKETWLPHGIATFTTALETFLHLWRQVLAGEPSKVAKFAPDESLNSSKIMDIFQFQAFLCVFFVVVWHVGMENHYFHGRYIFKSLFSIVMLVFQGIVLPTFQK